MELKKIKIPIDDIINALIETVNSYYRMERLRLCRMCTLARNYNPTKNYDDEEKCTNCFYCIEIDCMGHSVFRQLYWNSDWDNYKIKLEFKDLVLIRIYQHERIIEHLNKIIKFQQYLSFPLNKNTKINKLIKEIYFGFYFKIWEDYKNNPDEPRDKCVFDIIDKLLEIERKMEVIKNDI